MYFRSSFKSKMTYLIIDAGNTRTKTVTYTDDLIVQQDFFLKNEFDKLFNFINSIHYDFALLSSVLSEEETKFIQNHLLNCKLLREVKIPIKIEYKTPQTLGSDRIANAVASIHKVKGNRLIIDVGTCIKFDFVDTRNVFLGGSISPGIELRYRALHEFTGKLPYLSKTTEARHLGQSTSDCIHSGVMKGIQEEINGFIRFYENQYEDLTIFVTGGDHLYFDYSSKNDIFADENLTTFGLLQTLKTNV